MRICFCLILAMMVLSVSDALAAGNDTVALQEKFSSHFDTVFDLRTDRRGMMPMTLIDKDGRTSTLDQFKGKYILAHFWATWCAPCIGELPDILAFKKKYDGKNFAVVLINMDYGISNDRILKIMQFKEPTFKNFETYRVQPDDKTADNFQEFALPTSFFINPQGQVLYKVLGAGSWSNLDTDAFIQNMIKNPKN